MVLLTETARLALLRQLSAKYSLFLWHSLSISHSLFPSKFIQSEKELDTNDARGKYLHTDLLLLHKLCLYFLILVKGRKLMLIKNIDFRLLATFKILQIRKRNLVSGFKIVEHLL